MRSIADELTEKALTEKADERKGRRVGRLFRAVLAQSASINKQPANIARHQPAHQMCTQFLNVL